MKSPLASATTPADYRREITALADQVKVDLTAAAGLPAATEPLTKMVIRLREALCEVVDGTPAHHLCEEHAPMTIERAREIRALAGLDPNG